MKKHVIPEDVIDWNFFQDYQALANISAMEISDMLAGRPARTDGIKRLIFKINGEIDPRYLDRTSVLILNTALTSSKLYKDKSDTVEGVVRRTRTIISRLEKISDDYPRIRRSELIKMKEFCHSLYKSDRYYDQLAHLATYSSA
ncbi:MAG: hypothetical protein KJ623_01930 [Nanoarchaeota archaeon]|nr:hypothetical protein [Nanoarchaeota archaeon]MBU0963373.1 hypothetical protein [Nanoarchaeota archaeon]